MEPLTGIELVSLRYKGSASPIMLKRHLILYTSYKDTRSMGACIQNRVMVDLKTPYLFQNDDLTVLGFLVTF
jgi:hypothetical protein